MSRSEIRNTGFERPDQPSNSINRSSRSRLRSTEEFTERQPDDVGTTPLHAVSGSLQRSVEIIGEPNGELGGHEYLRLHCNPLHCIPSLRAQENRGRTSSPNRCIDAMIAVCGRKPLLIWQRMW